jgi:hypothetical protein
MARQPQLLSATDRIGSEWNRGRATPVSSSRRPQSNHGRGDHGNTKESIRARHYVPDARLVFLVLPCKRCTNQAVVPRTLRAISETPLENETLSGGLLHVRSFQYATAGAFLAGT